MKWTESKIITTAPGMALPQGARIMKAESADGMLLTAGVSRERQRYTINVAVESLGPELRDMDSGCRYCTAEGGAACERDCTLNKPLPPARFPTWEELQSAVNALVPARTGIVFPMWSGGADVVTSPTAVLIGVEADITQEQPPHA